MCARKSHGPASRQTQSHLSTDFAWLMSRQDRCRSPRRAAWNCGSSGSADGFGDLRMQLPHRCFDSGADVEALPVPGVAGCLDERVHHVVDEHVVAGRFAVAEDLGRLYRRAAHARRSRPRRPRRAGPDEVRRRCRVRCASTPGRRGCGTCSGRPRPRPCSPRTGDAGSIGHVLVGREGGGDAVDRSTRRGVHDLADAGAARRLCETDRADDVDRRVELRVVHRARDRDLRGQVEDDLRFRVGEQPDQVGVDDVGLGELEAGVPLAPGRGSRCAPS